MTRKYYFYLSYRIILLFIPAILIGVISPYIHGFFGDIPYRVPNEYCFIDDGYKWGSAHYWFNAMLLSLFILNAIDIKLSINSVIND